MMRAVKRLVSILVPILIVVAALIALGVWLVGQGHFDVLAPKGQIADQQRQLLIFTLLLSAVVVVPVFTMLIIFAIRFREGNKKAVYRPNWSKHRGLEVLWWGIPIVIIIVLAIATWITSHSLDPYKPIEANKPTLNVQVVALQWKWLFIYPDKGVASVGELAIPEKTPVHFSLTADAPMSAFWIPKLGSQIYSMNGMNSQLNLISDTTGEYTGYNTNINGEGYADMTFKVKALSDDDFAQWIKSGNASPNVMDETTYQELAKPSTLDKPIMYILMQPNLYDTIMSKYMHGMNGETLDTPSMDSMDMSHEHMNMEGM